MRHYRRMGFLASLMIIAMMIINLGTRVEAATKSVGVAILGTLPPLHVRGNRIVDPTGQTVLLRGIAIPDVEYVARYRRGGAPRAINEITDPSEINQWYAGWNPRVLRIPVYPEPKTDKDIPIIGWIDNPTYFKEYLEPAVQHCISKDLYCIIDWHWVSSYAVNDDADEGIDATQETRIDAETRAFWTRMVQEYANVPNVIFELFNEPIYPDDWETWRSKAQGWIDHIRGQGANNIILVGAPHWSLHTITANDTPFVGGNIAYTAHIYPGHTVLDPTAITPEQEASVIAKQPEVWDEWIGFASENYPLIITEFGWEDCTIDQTTQKCTNHPSGGSTKLFGRPFIDYIESHTQFPTYPKPLPKVAGWTAWVADYCLGPRMFDGNDRTFPDPDPFHPDNAMHQGALIKHTLSKYRFEYFPMSNGNVVEPEDELTITPEVDEECDDVPDGTPPTDDPIETPPEPPVSNEPVEN